MKFPATIEIYNGNPYVLVSKERANALRELWKKPLPVLVQINGQPKPAWRINMMPIGDGSFYLYLHGDVRKVSNTKVGDRVEVSLDFNSDYRPGPKSFEVAWFIKEVEKNETARQNWEKLTPSRQKEILRYLGWLKSDEAKKRNLEKVLKVLSGEPGRYLARSWKNGV